MHTACSKNFLLSAQASVADRGEDAGALAGCATAESPGAESPPIAAAGLSARAAKNIEPATRWRKRKEASICPAYGRNDNRRRSEGPAAARVRTLNGACCRAPSFAPVCARRGCTHNARQFVALSDAPSSDAFRGLAALLIKLRLPSLGNPSDGFLLSYQASPAGMAQIDARQVDRIFKGATPANVPIEQISTFELEINMRTASAIGLSIPQAVLLQATRLIQ